MRQLAYAAVFGAALGAQPAAATLQAAVQIGPDLLTCAEGQACDTSTVSGVLATNAAVLDVGVERRA
jgi:hypothetical protein